jgi:hypothetical protein
LAEESILTDDFLRELMNVGEVDILIGVPTYNDGKTVAQVVQAIRAGLVKYFPRQRAVIINADGGSRDDTPEIVRAASISDVQHTGDLKALRTLHSISTRYPGQPSSGTALHTILAAADLVRASSCAVISPESTSIEPEWIDRLLRPVSRDEFDLITPTYRRHKFEGLLVRNVVYPVVDALYKKRVREPYPSDYAFSSRLGTFFLNQDIWSQDVGRTGTELALTISAMVGGFRLAQAFLGSKSRTDHARGDIVEAMRQTVGVLFWSLEPNYPVWSAGGEPQPISSFGPESEVSLEPLRVNRKRLFEMFRHGVAELEPVLKSLLTPSTLSELQRIIALPEQEFCFSNQLWVRTVYEFAASYHKEVINRDHIIQALVPLYRGRAYCFLTENRDGNAADVERNIEDLCVTFEQSKPYLLELWNAGK